MTASPLRKSCVETRLQNDQQKKRTLFGCNTEKGALRISFSVSGDYL